MEQMLTLQKLKDMKPSTIFATGVDMDSPEGINMTGSRKELKWVAVRGEIHDWTIYIHFVSKTSEWIKSHGDKVCSENHIKKLVLCDNEAFEMYRY